MTGNASRYEIAPLIRFSVMHGPIIPEIVSNYWPRHCGMLSKGWETEYRLLLPALHGT